MNKAFTMIELLVVISIIGILSALAMVSFSSSQKQARDTARKSDIKQYSTSLENYANSNNGLYPVHTDASGVSVSTVLCADLGLSNCSEDPRNEVDETRMYKYQGTATKFVLWVKLENNDNYWVTCSTGKNGTAPSTNFSVTGGVCPI